MKHLLFLLCILTVKAYADTNYLIVSANYPPYQYEENGEIKGLSSAVVKEAFNKAGVQYSIKFVSWARAYKTALNTPNVFIYSIARTPSRETLFKWGGSILESKNCFISLQSRSDIELKNLESIQNHTVGVVRGDLVTSMLEDKRLGANLDYVETDLQNIKKLHSGRVDLIVTSEAAAIYMSKQAKKNDEDIKVHFCPEAFVYKFNIAANVNTQDDVFNRVASELSKLTEKSKDAY